MGKEQPSLKTFAKDAWRLAQFGRAALFVASRTFGTLDHDKRYMEDAGRFVQLAHGVPTDLSASIPGDSALRFFKWDEKERKERQVF